MAENDKQIQCMLLSLFKGALLLPRASVVHVIDSDKLDIVVDLQGGIIGKIQWQGWTVPLISFESILNESIPKFNHDTKSVIVHSLIDDGIKPFIALTSQGDPKPINITDKNMKIMEADSGDFVQNKVLINTKIEAYIPELPVLVTYTAQYL